MYLDRARTSSAAEKSKWRNASTTSTRNRRLTVYASTAASIIGNAVAIGQRIFRAFISRPPAAAYTARGS